MVIAFLKTFKNMLQSPIKFSIATSLGFKNKIHCILFPVDV